MCKKTIINFSCYNKLENKLLRRGILMSEYFKYCLSCGEKVFESDKHYEIGMCENCVDYQMREKRKDL